MSSNENPAQTNISHDRDDAPGSAPEHEGAPAPEDVPRPAPRSRPAPAMAAEPPRTSVWSGLAVMGSNLARNLASREGNTVAIYNRSHDKTEHLVAAHPEAEFVPAATYEEFAASLQQAPDGDHHGQGRRGHGCRHRRARGRVRAGRHHRRRRQRPVHRHDPSREGRARDRHQLRRRRHLRRRRGRPARPVDHARRLGRVLGHPRPDPARASPRSPRASRASRTSATTAPDTS